MTKDEYAEMHKLATEAARRGDPDEIRRLQKEYFQWAGAIRDIWEFEQKKRRAQMTLRDRILQFLKERPGTGLLEISAELEESPQAVQKELKALQHEGRVTRPGDPQNQSLRWRE